MLVLFYSDTIIIIIIIMRGNEINKVRDEEMVHSENELLFPLLTI